MKRARHVAWLDAGRQSQAAACLRTPPCVCRETRPTGRPAAGTGRAGDGDGRASASLGGVSSRMSSSGSAWTIVSHKDKGAPGRQQGLSPAACRPPAGSGPAARRSAWRAHNTECCCREGQGTQRARASHNQDAAGLRHGWDMKQLQLRCVQQGCLRRAQQRKQAGACLMLSMPPATTMLLLPSRMDCAPSMMALRPAVGLCEGGAQLQSRHTASLQAS